MLNRKDVRQNWDQASLDQRKSDVLAGHPQSFLQPRSWYSAPKEEIAASYCSLRVSPLDTVEHLPETNLQRRHDLLLRLAPVASPSPSPVHKPDWGRAMGGGL